MRLVPPHSIFAVDAYLRYLGWRHGDPYGLVYDSFTRPTAALRFHSAGFDSLRRRRNLGIWEHFGCIRSERLKLAGWSDPQADLSLLCGWLGVDRSEVEKLEDTLSCMAARRLNDGGRLLMQGCRLLPSPDGRGCSGFYLSIDGHAVCPVCKPRGGFSGYDQCFPMKTGPITEVGPPPNCTYCMEMIVHWGALHDEREKVVALLRNSMATASKRQPANTCS